MFKIGKISNHNCSNLFTDLQILDPKGKFLEEIKIYTSINDTPVLKLADYFKGISTEAGARVSFPEWKRIMLLTQHWHNLILVWTFLYSISESILTSLYWGDTEEQRECQGFIQDHTARKCLTELGLDLGLPEKFSYSPHFNKVEDTKPTWV